jgi:hypothetical protein
LAAVIHHEPASMVLFPSNGNCSGAGPPLLPKPSSPTVLGSRSLCSLCREVWKNTENLTFFSGPLFCKFHFSKWVF